MATRLRGPPTRPGVIGGSGRACVQAGRPRLGQPGLGSPAYAARLNFSVPGRVVGMGRGEDQAQKKPYISVRLLV
ncbi:hypothetical protein [Dyadobacter psychrophilus]|uniref:hypothetical protein n=1 Tax=Dyadobacter psychrophilus TaxID=651661 RepID=UPI0011318DF4|nr:hypothetical protein [Dyadobacter psychrophilus]